MEKTIIIDGQQVPFKSSGATALRYKMQFRKDYLVEIMKLDKLGKITDIQDIDPSLLDGVDFEVFYNIAWTMAKTANPSIADPLTWLDSFSEFPLLDIIPELSELIYANIESKKKIENDNEPGTSDREFSTETFLALCYRCKLTKADLEDLTIGMCLDYIHEYLELQKPSEQKVRTASQSDFDAF